METKMNEDAFSKLISENKSGLIDKLKWEEANEDWLEASAKIAFKVLLVMQQRGWNKTDLAFKLKVSNAYVSKLVKGRENLTIDTICKLEKVLDTRFLVDEVSPAFTSINRFKLIDGCITKGTTFYYANHKIDFQYMKTTPKVLTTGKTTDDTIYEADMVYAEDYLNA